MSDTETPSPPTSEDNSLSSWFTDNLPEWAKDAWSKTDFGRNLPNDQTLGQSKYDFTYRLFPSNLGAEGSYYVHYMVININVRKWTNFGDYIQGPETRGGSTGSVINTFTPDPEEMSKTDALRFKIDPNYSSKDGKPLGLDSRLLLPRFSSRIVESIALFMPQTVIYQSNAVYEDISLLGLGAGAVTPPSLGYNGKGRGLGGAALYSIGNLFGTVLGAAPQLGQMPFNPRIEVLFKTTPQREFLFEFLLAPTNEADSLAIEQIYRTLRFHQAPEIQSGWGSLNWVAPSDFDITFYNAGKENTIIPRINTCVLQSINMDYAAGGTYSTFSNGHPVTMRMTLQFRELEVVHKLRVAQGF